LKRYINWGIEIRFAAADERVDGLADYYSFKLLATPVYKRLNYEPTKFKAITVFATSPDVLIGAPSVGSQRLTS
jgi:hypothetical protein